MDDSHKQINRLLNRIEGLLNEKKEVAEKNKTMFDALHYYRTIWHHPESFALESLKKDKGKVAADAQDMVEVLNK